MKREAAHAPIFLSASANSVYEAINRTEANVFKSENSSIVGGSNVKISVGGCSRKEGHIIL